ncbi:hypothetical protein [Lactococcus lactis]|uniref:hypothetical protein n=1 Tax=Lactococcus lactis TaxID=1358 RepID=UPI0022E0B247|nr:hypothetical protein [Lactococcus lactis]
MSEEEKAKQEVEQVCFAYDKAGDTGDIKDWKYFYDLENKLIDKVKRANQPQLTIPKSVADMLYEELNPLERESMLEAFVLGINYLVLSDELMKFVLTGNNYHVISAYLAGKALGVDLVKVVEG